MSVEYSPAGDVAGLWPIVFVLWCGAEESHHKTNTLPVF
jgi:hypothetical protein